MNRQHSISNSYILPTIEYIDFEDGVFQYDVERFVFDTDIKISSGYFGSIYRGLIRSNSQNPLISQNGKGATYVMKIIKSKRDNLDFDINNALIEANIQSIIFDSNLDGLITPFMYRKIFVDKNKKCIGLVSEYVAEKSLTDLFLNNKIYTYRDMYADIIKPLNITLKKINNGEINIKLKHNDLHCGNYIIAKPKDGGLGYRSVMIDYGLTVISNVLGMEIDTNILNYNNETKIKDFMSMMKLDENDEKSMKLANLIMENFILTDWHLYFISLSHKVKEHALSLEYIKKQQESIIETKNVKMMNRIDEEFDNEDDYSYYYDQEDDKNLIKKLKSKIHAFDMMWGMILTQYELKYDFINNFKVDDNELIYNGIIVDVNMDLDEHSIIYNVMVSSVNENKRKKSMSDSIIIGWNIRLWRYLSIFIEMYLPTIDRIAYDISIENI
jgi:hypothetical protein